MKIYLDTCVWCRPFDKPSGKTIPETEAFFKILGMVDSDKATIVGSEVLDVEVDAVNSEQKKELVKSLMFYSITEKLNEVPGEYKNLIRLGLKIPDASHIACALKLGAEYFISVDKGLLNKRKKINEMYSIKLCSPKEYLELESE